MKKLFTLITLLLCLAFSATAATTTSTTLSAVVSSTSTTTIRVTAATGFVADSTYALVDQEVMNVLGVSGTTINVARGQGGTIAQAHNSGAIVYVGPSAAFRAYPMDPVGRCTAANYDYLPFINTRTGSLVNCTSSEFVVTKTGINGITAAFGNNLDIKSYTDSKPVRINSRDYTQATGDSIGVQIKPNQTISSTGTVKGMEVSPRCATGIACAGVIGIHVDADLKGTTAGAISGDVRGIELEMVTDDAGTRVITGNVSALKIRSAFSATSIGGKFVPIRIEFPETQTNSKTYDAVFELTGTIPLVWNSAPGTEPSTADGYIKVLVNGAERYIQLYSTAPTD